MRMGHLLDPLAHRLLELRTVSGTQWLLRLAGAGGMALALVVALHGGGFVGIVSLLLTATVAVAVLAQFLRPDSDLGVLGPVVIIVSLIGHDQLSVARAAAVGLALLGGHCAFALAATIPVHGVLERSAWSLTARSLLVVLAVSVSGGLLVIALSGVQLGAWMIVPGVLAVIALFVVVLPRAR